MNRVQEDIAALQHLCSADKEAIEQRIDGQVYAQHAHIPACMHAKINVCMHTCILMHVCIHFFYACLYASVNTRTHDARTCMQTFVRARVHWSYINAWIHACLHGCAYRCSADRWWRRSVSHPRLWYRLVVLPHACIHHRHTQLLSLSLSLSLSRSLSLSPLSLSLARYFSLSLSPSLSPLSRLSLAPHSISPLSLSSISVLSPLSLSSVWSCR